MKLEQELIDFLKHIMEVHTDQYGHLQVCSPDSFTDVEFDPTIERVVTEYLKTKSL